MIMNNKKTKQDLVEVVSLGNILTTAIDEIFHNLFEHKLYVYDNDVFFYFNGYEVNPDDYDGVYKLYVKEIKYLIEGMVKTVYPFNALESQTIEFFKTIK